VGAEIPILGTNAHWDAEGRFFVAEGDESDGTLRLYRPRHTVILNVEEEHLDYYKDLAAIDRVFVQLMDQTSGSIIYCADDEHTSAICRERAQAVSYGESAEATYRSRNIQLSATGSRFDAWRSGQLLGSVDLGVPGRHNVSNALAVITLASELGVPMVHISAALATFRGARRRFEAKLQNEHLQVFDDYGHHPTEIKATLAAARQCGFRKVHVIFQPHRYTRTRDLMEEFTSAFSDADSLFVRDIYAASEKPIEGINSESLAQKIREKTVKVGRYASSAAEAVEAAAAVAEEGDMILTLGAGSVSQLGPMILEKLGGAGLKVPGLV